MGNACGRAGGVGPCGETACPCSRKKGQIAAEAAQKWVVVELWASNGAPRTLSAKRREVLSVTMCACDTGVCGGRQQRAQAGGPHTKRQATRGASCACVRVCVCVRGVGVWRWTTAAGPSNV